MAGVEVRKVEREVGETGLGVGNRTDVTYELGAEIEGTWVPFGTVTEGRVSDFAARAEAEKQRAEQDKAGRPKAGA